MKTGLLALAVASFALSAIVPAGSAEAKAIKAKYKCDRGQSLKVVFDGKYATVSPTNGKMVTLRQQMSGDGFLYTKGSYSLRGRGDNATWRTGQGKHLTCRARG
jgi:membrane-bound inhibitor of C-type lysozyme